MSKLYDNAVRMDKAVSQMVHPLKLLTGGRVYDNDEELVELKSALLNQVKLDAGDITKLEEVSDIAASELERIAVGIAKIVTKYFKAMGLEGCEDETGRMD